MSETEIIRPSTAAMTVTPANTTPTAFLQPSRPTVKSSTTSGTPDVAESAKEAAAPTSRMYPHVFDPAGHSGEALLLVQQALRDARIAADSYEEGDIEGVSARLRLVAAACAKAHPLTRFNESFGAVVSFIRRATVTASAVDVTRQSLNALVRCMNQITINPMLDLESAADLIDCLSNEGWHGEHHAVERLVALLVAEERSPAERVRDEAAS